jgi:hypothetical protein
MLGVHVYLYSPKVWNDLYACKTLMLYQLFSYDVMFGNMCILEFPKDLDDLYVHKLRHIVNCFFRYSRMPAFSPKGFGRLVYEYI